MQIIYQNKRVSQKLSTLTLVAVCHTAVTKSRRNQEKVTAINGILKYEMVFTQLQFKFMDFILSTERYTDSLTFELSKIFLIFFKLFSLPQLLLVGIFIIFHHLFCKTDGFLSNPIRGQSSCSNFTYISSKLSLPNRK